MTDTILQTLAQELGRPIEHIQNVVTLIDEGATIPFIEIGRASCRERV